MSFLKRFRKINGLTQIQNLFLILFYNFSTARKTASFVFPFFYFEIVIELVIAIVIATPSTDLDKNQYLLSL